MLENAGTLMMQIVAGEEREKYRQRMILQYLDELCWYLEYGRELPYLKAAESVTRALFGDDRNYLYYHEFFMFNAVCQAGCLARENRPEEAVQKLKEAYFHAGKFDEAKSASREKPIPYICPLLNRLVFDPKTLQVSGTSTKTEDIREYLTWDWFDLLRDREDFQALENP